MLNDSQRNTMLTYSDFIHPRFTVVLDLTHLTTSDPKLINLSQVLKEHFALAEDRAHVNIVNPHLLLCGFNLSSERINQLISFLTCDALTFSTHIQDERTILIFE